MGCMDLGHGVCRSHGHTRDDIVSSINDHEGHCDIAQQAGTAGILVVLGVVLVPMVRGVGWKEAVKG